MRINKFKLRVEDEIGEDTAENYSRWIKKFDGFLGGETIDTVEGIEDHMADWDGHMKKNGLSRGTRKFAMYAVKRYCDTMHIPLIPKWIPLIRSRRREDFYVETLDESEVERIISGARDVHHLQFQTMCKVGYDCVCRSSEVCNILQEDLMDGRIMIRGVKGSEDYPNPISGEARELLGELYESRDMERREPWLFVTKGRKPFHPNNWSRQFSRLAEKVLDRHVTWHNFARHSRITNMLRSGMDFYEVYLRARHVRFEMTRRYAHLAGRKPPGRM